MMLPATRHSERQRTRLPVVLWLTETFFPSSGGMAQSCDRIVRGLRHAGIRIDLVHLVPAKPDATELAETGLRECAERIQGRDIRWALDEDGPHGMNTLFAWLEASLPEGGYTHVVAFGGRNPILAAPVFAAWFGARLVTLLRGNDFDTGILSARHRPALLEALRASSRIGAVTIEKVRKVRALLPEAEVAHTPNGIDLTDWRLLPSHREAAAAWRAERGLERRLVLGCFGHLKKKKGIGLLLDALLESGCAERVHLHLVGALEPEVAARLSGDGVPVSSSRCEFVPRSQLPGEFARCDCVVIPSFYDGMPNVLLEAGGLGLPLLASDTGGMRDVLGDGTEGWLFPAGDVQACAAALRRACATTPEQRAAMGSALRLHIERNYGPGRETACYLDILQQPLTSPPS